MKKFILISIAIFSISAVAQVNSPVQQMLGYAPGAGVAGGGCYHCGGTKADTVTNTGFAYDSIVLNMSYNVASIEVQCTKISGTLGGTLKVQALNKMTSTPSWITLNDTATVTNTSGTKSYFFQLPGPQRLDNTATQNYPVPPFLPFYIYRVLWTGTGTMSGSMKAYFVGRHL